MSERSLERLIARAEALLGRLEAVLPHPPAAPDWGAAIAFRYRRRGGKCAPGRSFRGANGE